MRITSFNYYCKQPKHISRLVRKLEKIYLGSLDYTPRDYLPSLVCVAYNIVRMVKFDFEACTVILGNSLPIPLPIVNGRIIGSKPSKVNTVRLLRTLERQGLITLYKGYRLSEDERESSFLTLEPKMFDLINQSVKMDLVKISLQEDVLVLRDSDKNQLAYERTTKLKDMITQIKLINNKLERHEVTYEQEVVKVALKRIFNSGSFELGGRFYEGQGNIQTLPSEERRKLRIDGRECISLDFSALHLSIAYSLVGAHWLEGFCPYNTELGGNVLVHPVDIEVFVKAFGKDPSYNPVRNLIKISVLVMINSRSTRAALGALRNKFTKDLSKVGTPLESSRLFAGIDAETLNLQGVVDSIIQHNWEVDKYFNSGVGTELQFIDSQIMAGILTDLAEQDIVALPIHDSLIVQTRHQDALLKSMVEHYKEVCGNDFNCRIAAKW